MAALEFSERCSERERWICIYPLYINNKRSIREGRRVPKSRCVDNPTCREIFDVVKAAGFQADVENKSHPREQREGTTFKGRVRIQLRKSDGGPTITNFPTKKSLLFHICETIPNLKTRSHKQVTSDQIQNIQHISTKRVKGKKGRR